MRTWAPSFFSQIQVPRTLLLFWPSTYLPCTFFALVVLYSRPVRSGTSRGSAFHCHCQYDHGFIGPPQSPKRCWEHTRGRWSVGRKLQERTDSKKWTANDLYVNDRRVARLQGQADEKCRSGKEDPTKSASCRRVDARSTTCANMLLCEDGRFQSIVPNRTMPCPHWPSKDTKQEH